MGRRLREDRGKCSLTLRLAGILALAMFIGTVGPSHGDGDITVVGRVINGTTGEFAPRDVEVTLHVIETNGTLDASTASTAGDGTFVFTGVPVVNDSVYAVAVRHQEVLYSTRLDTAGLGDPVELTIYDGNDDLGPLQIDAQVLLISAADGDSRTLSAFEVVSVVNQGDHTFLPDLERPAGMKFLRFGLPTGASKPEVASDLAGGNIIDVGTGFALTAPVPPGAHRVTYSYRIGYEGSKLDLTHSFPMGAGAFRLLLAEGLADLQDPGLLTRVEPVQVEGRSYQAWVGEELTPGSRIQVEVAGLPQPSAFERLGEALVDGPYLKIGIPSAVGFVFSLILMYVVLFRRSAQVSTVTVLPSSGVPALLTGAGTEMVDERWSLVNQIAELDDLFQQGAIEQADFQQQRQELKEHIRDIDLSRQRE